MTDPIAYTVLFNGSPNLTITLNPVTPPPVPPSPPPPGPDVVPPSPPPPPPSPPGTLPILPAPVRNVLAVFDLPGSIYAYGAMCVDFETRSIWVADLGGNHRVLRYDLPPEAGWSPTGMLPATSRPSMPDWYSGGNGWISANGLWYDGTRVWAACRHFFDQAGGSHPIIASDGTQTPFSIDTSFGGFYKVGTGVRPFLGASGHTSCKNDRMGPTIARWDDNGPTVLKDWPGYYPPFAERMIRDPNYFLSGGWEGVPPADYYYCLPPQNGVGAWGSEVGLGNGGVVDKDGNFRAWVTMGDGERAYKWPGGGQSLCFSKPENCWTAEYVLSGKDYSLIGWSEYKLPGWEFGRTIRVYGSEIDAAGRLYQVVGDVWNGRDMKMVIYDRVK